MKNAIVFVLILGALVFAGTKWHMHRKVGDSVDIAVLMVAPFVEITYEGVSSTLSGQLTVDGVRHCSPSITHAQLVGATLRFEMGPTPAPKGGFDCSTTP